MRKIKQIKHLQLSLIILLLAGNNLFSQEVELKSSWIKTGIGLGINEGDREIGMGLVYSIGWQKSLDKKERLRINPNILFGGFIPFAITDTRDQFYRISSFGLNLHYDLIRYKAISLVTTVGTFANYSRGLLGTGGWPEANNNSSEYFFSFYFGGNASAGIRIAPRNRKLAFEIRPISIHLGTNGYLLGYYMFNIDIKIGE